MIVLVAWRKNTAKANDKINHQIRRHIRDSCWKGRIAVDCCCAELFSSRQPHALRTRTPHRNVRNARNTEGGNVAGSERDRF